MKYEQIRLTGAIITIAILFAATVSTATVAAQEACMPPGSAERIHVASVDSAVFTSDIPPTRATLMTLAGLLRRYDLVALRDIRGEGDRRLSTLLGMMNETRECYEVLRSDPVAREVGSYVYLYNQFRLEVSGLPYSFDADEEHFRRRVKEENEAELPRDIYAWEPYIAQFRTLDEVFDFAVMNNHVTEAATQAEIDMLPFVAANVVTTYGDPDVLILGDLTISDPDEAIFPEGAFTEVARPEPKEGQPAKQIQRMLITSSMELEYTGESGELPFAEYYAESGAAPPLRPDHRTRVIYAEFRKSEDRDRTATNT